MVQFSGAAAKPSDSFNVDWVPSLHLPKVSISAQTEAQITQQSIEESVSEGSDSARRSKVSSANGCSGFHKIFSPDSTIYTYKIHSTKMGKGYAKFKKTVSLHPSLFRVMIK